MNNAAQNPRVSVIMAVHNNCQYVERAVDSILMQTFVQFELIIVNDGSTDQTLEIISNKAEKDARIKIISQENMGLTRSLNRALNVASGEFIARMDGDDESVPDRFALQVHFLETHPDAVVVGSWVTYINESGRSLFTRRYPTTHQEIENAHLGGYGGFVNHSSAMIRASALRQVSGYDESFPKAQDYDLWMRLTKIGEIQNLPKPLLRYRFHSKMISRKHQEAQKNSVSRVLTRELAMRQLEKKLQLDENLYIDPLNPYWLITRASEDGFITTSLVCLIQITINSLRQIKVAFSLFLKSFLRFFLNRT
jgi:glycosyltransferase involved in cell wall biosynthesis